MQRTIGPKQNNKSPLTFAIAKSEFDAKHKNLSETARFLPEHGKMCGPIKIRGANGEPNEQYYKWQFLTALINSGLYAKDYVGTEVFFPKGNKAALFVANRPRDCPEDSFLPFCRIARSAGVQGH
jgi:hypothetical protein